MFETGITVAAEGIGHAFNIRVRIANDSDFRTGRVFAAMESDWTRRGGTTTGGVETLEPPPQAKRTRDVSSIATVLMYLKVITLS